MDERSFSPQMMSCVHLSIQNTFRIEETRKDKTSVMAKWFECSLNGNQQAHRCTEKVCWPHPESRPKKKGEHYTEEWNFTGWSRLCSSLAPFGDSRQFAKSWKHYKIHVRLIRTCLPVSLANGDTQFWIIWDWLGRLDELGLLSFYYPLTILWPLRVPFFIIFHQLDRRKLHHLNIALNPMSCWVRGSVDKRNGRDLYWP